MNWTNEVLLLYILILNIIFTWDSLLLDIELRTCVKERSEVFYFNNEVIVFNQSKFWHQNKWRLWFFFRVQRINLHPTFVSSWHTFHEKDYVIPWFTKELILYSTYFFPWMIYSINIELSTENNAIKRCEIAKSNIRE